MRIAHIIMAHKNPTQIVRLVKRLEHHNSDIYIHIDKKIPIEGFSILNGLKQVYFINNRTKCNWGGNSLSLSIINSLKEVVSLSQKYDYINLLSGQDYPLVSAEEIFKFLSEKNGMNFISYNEAKDSDWWKSVAPRYERYHFTDFNFRWKHTIETAINIVAPKRKFPVKLELYGGNKSTWWTLTGSCAAEVIKAIDNSTKLNSFLRYSWGVDEFIIPTMVMNSSHKKDTINDNLRYIDWSGGSAHPKLLGNEDIHQIKSSAKIFARKFDTDYDDQVLDLIDEVITKK